MQTSWAIYAMTVILRKLLSFISQSSNFDGCMDRFCVGHFGLPVTISVFVYFDLFTDLFMRRTLR